MDEDSRTGPQRLRVKAGCKSELGTVIFGSPGLCCGVAHNRPQPPAQSHLTHFRASAGVRQDGDDQEPFVPRHLRATALEARKELVTNFFATNIQGEQQGQGGQ